MFPPETRVLPARPHFAAPVIAPAFLGARSKAAQPADLFEAKIRPLLAEHCYDCHSAEKKQKAGLVLDSRAGWEKGGDSGSPIVPGKPEDSLLVKAIHWADKDLRMPPEKAGGKLSDGQIADLEKWIKGGAFDPRTDATGVPVKKTW